MESIKITSGAYFKSLKVVHFAMVVGVVFFALVSIFFHQMGFGTIGKEINNVMLAVVPIFALIGIRANNLIFKNKLNKITELSSLRDKMDNYRSALIIKFALIEGSSFFAVVAYMLTGDYIYLGITVILLVTFVIYSPNRNKLINDLRLTKPESDLLNNPETEID